MQRCLKRIFVSICIVLCLFAFASCGEVSETKSYKVTLVVDGVGYKTYTVKKDTALRDELPVPEIPGLVFDGWYDSFGNELKKDTVIAGDRLFNAKFIRWVSANELLHADNIASITKYGSVKVTGNLGDLQFAVLKGLRVSEMDLSEANFAAVPAEAFEGNIYIKTLKLPTSVTGIEARAFKGMTGLADISGLHNITTIGEYAFSGCYNLKEIELNGVESMATGTFMNCSALLEINLGRNIKNMGSYIFDNCTALKNINVAADSDKYFSHNGVLYSVVEQPGGSGGVETIYTLIKCPEGKTGKVNVHHSTNIIGEAAFFNACNITEVDLTETSFFSAMGKKVFYNCTALKEIKGVSGIRVIEDYTFYNCVSLENFNIARETEEIGDYAFYNCISLKTLTFQSGSFAESIGDSAFYGCISLQSVVLPFHLNSLGEATFAGCVGLKNVEFSAVMYTLPDYTFKGCSNLVGITGGWNTITSIGKSAFESCVKFNQLLPSPSLEYIGEKAFFGCVNLNITVLPESLLSIEPFAFSGCVNLRLTAVPGGVYVLNERIFENCVSLVSLETGIINEFNKSAFWGCTNLSDVNFEDGSIVTTESGVIYTNDNRIISCLNGAPTLTEGGLKTVTLRAASTVITDFAFFNCKQIQFLNLAGIVTINPAAFAYCTSLQTVVLNEGLTSISENLFFGCVALKNVGYQIGSGAGVTYSLKNIKNIAGGAFYATRALKSADLQSVITIGESAFEESGILAVVIPSSATSIGKYAFYNATSLKTVNINSSAVIPEYAFFNCVALETVTYFGTKVSAYAFSYCSSLKNLTFTGSLNTVSAYAFYACVGLTDVVLPVSVRSIGSYAFYECGILENVTLPVLDEEYVGYYIFGYMETPTYIKRLKLVGYNPNINIDKAYIDKILVVKDYLVRLEISGSVTRINSATNAIYGVFADCGMLDTVVIGDVCNYIGAYAFANCRAITSLTVPFTIDFTILAFDKVFGSVKNLMELTVTGSGILSENWFADKFIKVGGKYTVTKLNITGNVGVSDSSGEPVFNASRFYYLNELTIDTTGGVGDYAFMSCKLIKLTVKNTSLIGAYAFANNLYLTTFVLHVNDSMGISGTAFSATGNIGTLEVYGGMLEAVVMSKFGSFANSFTNLKLYNLGLGAGALSSVNKVENLHIYTTLSVASGAFNPVCNIENLFVETNDPGSEIPANFLLNYPNILKNVYIASEFGKIKMGAFSDKTVDSLRLYTSTAVESGIISGLKKLNVVKSTATPIVFEISTSYLAKFGSESTLEDFETTAEVIGVGAFKNYPRLMTARIRNAVVIEDEAFRDAPLLLSVTFASEASIAYIGEYVFDGTTFLTARLQANGKFIVGKFIVKIDARRLSASERQLFVIASGYYVSGGAFDGVSGIKGIRFNNLIGLMEKSLVGLTLVENLYFENINPSALREYLTEDIKLTTKYIYVKNPLIEGSGTAENPVYVFDGYTALEKVALNCSNIRKYAFGNCSRLKTIVLGESVRTVDDEAFRNCGAGNDSTAFNVYVKSRIIDYISSVAFNVGTRIYIPSGMYAKYVSEWKTIISPTGSYIMTENMQMSINEMPS